MELIKYNSIAISGVHGIGKDKLCSDLLTTFPNSFVLPKSTTDRQRRESDDDDRYVFLAPEEYTTCLISGAFITSITLGDGTRRAWSYEEIEKTQELQKIPIFLVATSTIVEHKDNFPNTCSVYLKPATLEIPYYNLVNYRKENPDKIKYFMGAAREELIGLTRYKHFFDRVYVIPNINYDFSLIVRSVGDIFGLHI